MLLTLTRTPLRGHVDTVCDACTVHGPCVEHAWGMRGPHVGHAWATHGETVLIHAPRVGHTCATRAPCMCHAWHTEHARLAHVARKMRFRAGKCIFSAYSRLCTIQKRRANSRKERWWQVSWIFGMCFCGRILYLLTTLTVSLAYFIGLPIVSCVCVFMFVCVCLCCDRKNTFQKSMIHATTYPYEN